MPQTIPNSKFCLPIIKENSSEIVLTIKNAPPSYQIIEIWLDYIQDLSDQALSEMIAARGSTQLLFLTRRQQLEPPRLDLDDRQKAISYLIGYASGETILLDLDIRKQQEEISWMTSQGSQLPLILSYHNYQCTPSIAELRTIVKEMEQANASIFKFSTYCQSSADGLVLLNLLLELRAQKKRCTVLGMGAEGLITRLFGPLWGSEIAYAPQVMAESSAPGQVTLTELEHLLNQLQVIHGR